ncbi:MAG: peptidase [Rhodospirillales bacterium]|nr:peptidase [Rhodospirillales bacterium]
MELSDNLPALTAEPRALISSDDAVSPTVRITTLPNGLRVATDTMPHVESATVGIWTSCGARNETAAENGVAHLLEHMLFKGTGRRSAQIIAEEIEAVGGQMNAYTARENTAYYARVLKEDVGLAVDIVADLLQHSVFDEVELGRERSVVLQEIGQANDTPDDIIFDHFQSAAFPGQPMGRPVLGTPDTVANMSRAALTHYLGTHYVPSELVLTAAGAVDHDRLVDQALRQFDHLPAVKPPAPVPVVYEGGDFREEQDLEQLHFLLGFQGAAIGDADYYAQSMLSTVLGGGMSSRLFQEVREKRGLVYSIYTFASAYRDGGVFGVYAGTGPAEIAALVPVVCDELQKIIDHVDEAELGRARAQIKAGLLMSMESTMSRAEQLGQHLLLFGRTIPTKEIIEKIDEVDADSVKKAAAKLFASKPTIAAMGPIGHLESYDHTMRRFS